MIDRNSIPVDIQRMETQWIAWLNYVAAGLAIEDDALPFHVHARRPPRPIDAAVKVAEMFEAAIKRVAVNLFGRPEARLDPAPYFQQFCAAASEIAGTAPGSHLEYDAFSPTHISRARMFSPIALYHAIVADHFGGHLDRVNKADLARSVSALFGKNEAIQTRSGCAVLTVGALSKRHSYDTAFYYTSDPLRDHLPALVSILTDHLSRPGYLPDAEAARKALFQYHTSRVETRQRLVLTPDLTLVFYQRKIELLIPLDVAHRLNAFLSEWMPETAQARPSRSCAP
jgi:hypothetical protein